MTRTSTTSIETPIPEARIPTLVDPTLAPNGKHVMSVQMQYAPNFPGAVLHRQVWTLLDLERQFGLPEGNAYHGDLMLDQVRYRRPVPGCSRYRTPVRDPYLCGSGTHLGGGIAGGEGANAVRAILRDAQ